MADTIVAEVKDGEFHGETVEVLFGDTWANTEVFLNGEKLYNVQHVGIDVAVDLDPQISLHLMEEK